MKISETPGWLPRGRLKRQRGLSALMAIIVAVLCAILAARQAQQRKGEPEGQPERGGHGTVTTSAGEGATLEPGRVTRVDDGDTIRLADGRVVRYLGIDAPEENEPFHDEAKRRNQSLVGGQEIELREGGPETSDRYGRSLAVVHVRSAGGESVSVQQSLLREGLAWVYLRDAESVHPAFLRDLLSAQGKALREEKGIWHGIFERFRTRGEPLVSTRLRIHKASCSDVQEARPRPVESLEEELRRGKSLCRSCKPLRAN